MKAYPALYKDYPGQVQCILLRNVSATDDENKFPYDTAGFKDIPQDNYMFFNVPDDLKKLDIANGQCYNASVPQHVTFGYQNLPFGLEKDAGLALPPPRITTVLIGVAVVLLAIGL